VERALTAFGSPFPFLGLAGFVDLAGVAGFVDRAWLTLFQIFMRLLLQGSVSTNNRHLIPWGHGASTVGFFEHDRNSQTNVFI